MKRILFVFVIFSSMFCNTKRPSAYAILSEKKINEINIQSYQFSNDGIVLLKLKTTTDIDHFKSWLKPSAKTIVEPADIKRFKPDGLIEISIKNEEPIVIYYQLFNCFKMRYSGRLFYERFSYQFGHSLVELFEQEARNHGKEYEP